MIASLPGPASNLLLDIAISLIATFLLASLLVTAAQELLARFLSMRSKMLYAAIAGMLTRDFNQTDASGATINGTDGKPLPATEQEAQKFLDAFHNNPLIKALSAPNASRLVGLPIQPRPLEYPKNYPSYIPAQLFRSAVLARDIAGGIAEDLHKAAGTGTANFALKALNSLAEQTQGEFDAFRLSIEAWFDGVMDRVNGAYKRWSQVTTFLIGLAVAGLFNIDAIHMTAYLLERPAIAARLADASADLTKGNASSGNAADVEKILRDAGAPIGWGALLNKLKIEKGVSSGETFFQKHPILHCFLILSGWLITALATMLGAQFWFDTLKRFVAIRSSGVAPDEKAK